YENQPGWSEGSIGCYLPGYGALFLVDGSTGFTPVLRRLRTQLKAVRQQQQMLRQMLSSESVPPPEPPAPPVSASAVSTDQSGAMLQEVKDKLADFLGNYAPTLSQLKDNERVSVVVDLYATVPSLPTSLPEDESVSDFPSMIEATAFRKDLEAHRRGELSPEAFRKRIVYREHPVNREIEKRMKIMGNILKTALSEEPEEVIGLTGEPGGVYLAEIGVVFFVKPEVSRVTMALEKFMRISQSGRAAQSVPISPEEEEDSAGQVRAKMQRYRQELLKLVGEYGTTLRPLKPEKQIVVISVSENGWGSDDEEAFPDQLILMVKKADVDAYAAGRIRLNALEKRARWIEF
ncbi:MAG: hypothetical protein D6681_15400, partial [Calditrichaeota bacterium]